MCVTHCFAKAELDDEDCVSKSGEGSASEDDAMGGVEALASIADVACLAVEDSDDDQGVQVPSVDDLEQMKASLKEKLPDTLSKEVTLAGHPFALTSDLF